MKYVIYAILVVLASILVIGVLGGCRCLQPQPTVEVIPDTLAQAFIKTVYKTNWLVTVGIISIAISAVAFKNGARGACDWLLGSLILVGTTLAVIKFGVVLAIVCAVTGIGWLLYTLFLKDRALKEIVRTTEIYKKWVKEASQDVVKNTIKTDIQSPQTTKLVSKIKGEE